ncbi:hypothetical protein N7454_010138 [Penicillium verhagenii]|nr:hypothetical protein N7454_010138 [Penicillium verhagenii]
MQFQPMCPVHFIHPQQLRPRFCILRPGGVPTALIAADELPSWLRISNPSPDVFIGLQPVSPTYIPREGEYQVTCNNCSSSASSMSVNHSVSDRNEDVQTPNSAGSGTRSCTSAQSLYIGKQENGAAIVPKFPIGFTIGNSPFDATLQSPVIGLYSSNIPPVPPRTVDVPVSTVSQPESSVGSSSGSERLSTKLGKSEKLDTPGEFADSSENPDTCAGSSNRTSIASTRSLTAAVERLRKKLNLKRLSRQNSFRQKVHRAVQADSDWPKQPKAHRVRSKAPRRVRTPRRRRVNSKKSKTEHYSLIEKNKDVKLSFEQPNSATKRCDRRERLTQRLLHGRHDVDRKSGYWHMAKIPK